MSDGLKHRLVLAEIALSKPHILLLDEPTNASDLEGVDSLAEAINAYVGGVVVISHDWRLLSKIVSDTSGGQIWVRAFNVCTSAIHTVAHRGIAGACLSTYARPRSIPWRIAVSLASSTINPTHTRSSPGRSSIVELRSGKETFAGTRSSCERNKRKRQQAESELSLHHCR